MDIMRLLFVLALTALSGCASAPSGTPPRNAARMAALPDYVLAADTVVFTEADTDHDRQTTSSELGAWVDAQWKFLSRDTDMIGVVRFDEWTQSVFGPVDVASQFGSLSFDRNMNGQITRDEFITELRRRFTFRDANADGVLQRGEMWVRLPRMPSMQGMPRGMPPGGMPRGGPHGGGRPPGM